SGVSRLMGCDGPVLIGLPGVAVGLRLGSVFPPPTGRVGIAVLPPNLPARLLIRAGELTIFAPSGTLTVTGWVILRMLESRDRGAVVAGVAPLAGTFTARFSTVRCMALVEVLTY